MKRVFLYAILCLFSIQAHASKVIASTFGFNPTDVTLSIQSAITSGADTVVIDNQNAIWYTKPNLFFNISNMVLIIEPGVEIKAMSSEFNATDAVLFNFKNATNLKIIGYSAILSMQKPEYIALNNSEFRHGLSFWNCTDIAVYGLLIKETGGDGIYIGGENTGGNLGYCRNVIIEDVRCINNYRQGLSICSVENMTVRYSEFSETVGTAPEAGIDVEPYETYMRIVNLNIEKCAFKRNNWAGISIALVYMDGSSLPVSIEVKDCLFEKNGFGNTSIYQECEIYANANDTFPVQGTVLFERCQITESDWSAFYTRKTHDAYNITFKECAFMHVSGRQDLYNEPFFLEVPSYAAPSDYVGNLTFNNCLVSYSTIFPFFRVYGFSTLLGVKDITGNFTVFAPNNQGVLYTAVADTVNATFSFVNYISPPMNQVSVSSPNPIAEECGLKGSMEFTRFDTNLNYPLPVTYAVTSNTTLANDIHFLTGGAVIPSQTTQFFDTIIARSDFITEPEEDVIFSLLPATHYTIVPTFAPAQVRIIDCAVSALEENSLRDSHIFPNPSNGIFSIETSDSEIIKVFDITGKFLIAVQASQQLLDLTFLTNGIYFLEIKNSRWKVMIQ